MIVTFEFDGKRYDLEHDDITLAQGVALHKIHGMTVNQYLDGLGTFDARSYQFLYWLMMQQNGHDDVPVDRAGAAVKLFDFAGAWADARGKAIEVKKAEQAALEQAQPQVPVVPTVPDGITGQPWPGSGYQTDMTQATRPPEPLQRPAPTGY